MFVHCRTGSLEKNLEEKLGNTINGTNKITIEDGIIIIAGDLAEAGMIGGVGGAGGSGGASGEGGGEGDSTESSDTSDSTANTDSSVDTAVQSESIDSEVNTKGTVADVSATHDSRLVDKSKDTAESFRGTDTAVQTDSAYVASDERINSEIATHGQGQGQGSSGGMMTVEAMKQQQAAFQAQGKVQEAGRKTESQLEEARFNKIRKRLGLPIPQAATNIKDSSVAPVNIGDTGSVINNVAKRSNVNSQLKQMEASQVSNINRKEDYGNTQNQVIQSAPSLLPLNKQDAGGSRSSQSPSPDEQIGDIGLAAMLASSFR